MSMLKTLALAAIATGVATASFAGEVADRVVFMDHGKIVESGRADSVLVAPVQQRTKDFIAAVLK
jgi:polar amino acid transport system ATP-binding protein